MERAVAAARERRRAERARAAAVRLGGPAILFAQAQMKNKAYASSVAVAMEAPPPTPNTQVASSHQVFHHLFRDDGRGAISCAVRELWGVRTAAAAELNPALTGVASSKAADTPTPASVNALYRAQRPRN